MRARSYHRSRLDIINVPDCGYDWKYESLLENSKQNRHIRAIPIPGNAVTLSN
jgi:hypothetical protein